MSTVESYAQGTPSYVELTTPDQEAAKAFYGPLFGWEFEDVDMGEAGVYVAVSVQGDSVAGIAGQMPQLQGHPAFWGVSLAVDDVDAVAAKVAELGGKVEAGPFDVEDLGRMARSRTRPARGSTSGRPGRTSARCGSTSPAARSGTS